jgi:hypothetical protein
MDLKTAPPFLISMQPTGTAEAPPPKPPPFLGQAFQDLGNGLGHVRFRLLPGLGGDL